MRNPCKKENALFNILKDGKVHDVADILEKVDITEEKKSTLTVYVFNLRDLFGVKITTIREGKKTKSYQMDLENLAEVEAKFNVTSKRGRKKGSVLTVKPVTTKQEKPTEFVPPSPPSSYGDKEVSDIMNSLGIR